MLCRKARSYCPGRPRPSGAGSCILLTLRQLPGDTYGPWLWDFVVQRLRRAASDVPLPCHQGPRARWQGPIRRPLSARRRRQSLADCWSGQSRVEVRRHQAQCKPQSFSNPCLETYQEYLAHPSAACSAACGPAASVLIDLMGGVHACDFPVLPSVVGHKSSTLCSHIVQTLYSVLVLCCVPSCQVGFELVDALAAAEGISLGSMQCQGGHWERPHQRRASSPCKAPDIHEPER